MNEILSRFQDQRPSFHLDGTEDWSLSAEAARFIGENIPQGGATLETGAGLSTVIFADRAARHFCICPDKDETRRIVAYCAANKVDTGKVTFINDLSESVLPSLETPPLDLVLIDGGHGFPMPIIDWYFVAGKLKVGGVLVIDDIHLWPCAILVDFLKADAGWQSMGAVGRYAHAFRKTAPFGYLEFCFQPYVVRKSRVGSAAVRLLTAWDLLRTMNVREFARRARRDLPKLFGAKPA